MDFLIKTYKVPIFRDEKGKVNFKEVKLDKNNLIKTIKINLKHSFEIPMEAKKINRDNGNILDMARIDGNITAGFKKVLCKSDISPIRNK